MTAQVTQRTNNNGKKFVEKQFLPFKKALRENLATCVRDGVALCVLAKRGELTIIREKKRKRFCLRMACSVESFHPAWLAS
jgi:hypothetical protein